MRTPVVGRKNYYGSDAKWAADLAGDAWTVLGTARQAGLAPRRYLTAYLTACAENGGKPPAGEALERFLPWAASESGLAAWRPATAATAGDGSADPAPAPAPAAAGCAGPAP